LERRNGWRPAEATSDAAPDGVPDFLSRLHRDADAVRDDLRACVVENLGDPDAVLVPDETEFPKRGDKSAGPNWCRRRQQRTRRRHAQKRTRPH